MRLIDAFRSLPEQEAMQKPARWAVVYEDHISGGQWVGCFWSDRATAVDCARGSSTALFILKVTPK